MVACFAVFVKCFRSKVAYMRLCPLFDEITTAHITVHRIEVLPPSNVILKNLDIYCYSLS